MDLLNGVSEDSSAKRLETQNHISRLLGQYLLKGYRMLNEVCDHCETVLMQNKENSQKYCVACSEIYGEIVGKKPEEEAEGGSASPVQQVMSMGNVSSFRVAEEALCGKLEWAARNLEKTENVAEAERMVGLMKTISDGLLAINEAAKKVNGK